MNPKLVMMSLLLISLFFTTDIRAQAPDTVLTELRNQFALKHMQPEAHFALAKYYLDRDNF